MKKGYNCESMDLDAVFQYKTSIDTRLTEYLLGMKDTGVNLWQKDVITRLLSFVAAGKTIRGCLTVYGYSLYAKNIPDEIYTYAAAMELLHAGLLIHDDIMDSDELRRGQVTIHKQYEQLATNDAAHFGVSMGINVADFCFFSGSKLLASVPANIHSWIHQEFMNVTIAQMHDISGSMLPNKLTAVEILSIYTYKTARYTFSVPLMLGARLAGVNNATIHLLDQIGEHIGIMFQLRDDELSITGDTTKTGKAVGGDAREHKQTLFSRISKTGTDTIMKQRAADAKRLILSLDISTAHKEALLQLAQFVQKREN